MYGARGGKKLRELRRRSPVLANFNDDPDRDANEDEGGRARGKACGSESIPPKPFFVRHSSGEPGDMGARG